MLDLVRKLPVEVVKLSLSFEVILTLPSPVYMSSPSTRSQHLRLSQVHKEQSLVEKTWKQLCYETLPGSEHARLRERLMHLEDEHGEASNFLPQIDCSPHVL